MKFKHDRISSVDYYVWVPTVLFFLVQIQLLMYVFKLQMWAASKPELMKVQLASEWIHHLLDINVVWQILRSALSRVHVSEKSQRPVTEAAAELNYRSPEFWASREKFACWIWLQAWIGAVDYTVFNHGFAASIWDSTNVFR